MASFRAFAAFAGANENTIMAKRFGAIAHACRVGCAVRSVFPLLDARHGDELAAIHRQRFKLLRYVVAVTAPAGQIQPVIAWKSCISKCTLILQKYWPAFAVSICRNVRPCAELIEPKTKCLHAVDVAVNVQPNRDAVRERLERFAQRWRLAQDQ